MTLWRYPVVGLEPGPVDWDHPIASCHQILSTADRPSGERPDGDNEQNHKCPSR